MLDFLHITNGDGAASILKRSSVRGDVLPWRDPMHHGPFPTGLDLDAVSEIRARYLVGDVDEHDAEAVRDFQLRNEHLKAAARYQEVILWFEHDLLDQLQILQLLDWFASQDDIKPKALTMICIDRFSGIESFRGLGQLDCDQMASLLTSRQSVTPQQMQLAKTGWAAFRSPNPKQLEAFTRENLAPLPFLRAALIRHLQDYPWIADGLTRTERQILTLVSDGVIAPGQIFFENMSLESVLFIGDWRTYHHVSELCKARRPLLHCEPNGTFSYPPNVNVSREQFRTQRISLTDVGKQVLSENLNATDIIERDEWLGGVHLKSDNPMWMWDAHGKQLTLRNP